MENSKCSLKIFLKKLIEFFLILFYIFVPFKIRAQMEIPRDVLIAAIVQPWLYFEVFPLDLSLAPDLISPTGEVNIGESPVVSLIVGTNNRGGWEIKIKGKNNGLKSQATGYLIKTVNQTSTLVAGLEGYGLQATTTLSEVIINPIYKFYGTDIVGEISSQNFNSLAIQYSLISLTEVAKFKIKASASLKTSADINYEDEIILTIIPLV